MNQISCKQRVKPSTQPRDRLRWVGWQALLQAKDRRHTCRLSRG
jgi:hypothetical protein